MQEEGDPEVAATMFKVSLIDGLPITASDIAAATTKDPMFITGFAVYIEG